LARHLLAKRHFRQLREGEAVTGQRRLLEQ